MYQNILFINDSIFHIATRTLLRIKMCHIIIKVINRNIGHFLYDTLHQRLITSLILLQALKVKTKSKHSF